MNHSKVLSVMCGVALAFGTVSAVQAKTIRIGIGHQSMVTNTVSGGIVLEKLDLIPKYLPKTGKYADTDYEFEFKDYTSGPPITNQMMAGKLDFGVMGDYPLIVNGAKFQAGGNAESRFIGVTGYNAEGTGNAIVVPVSSSAQTLADLEGKNISTPVGSAAWGMTLKALSDAGLTGKVNILNQSPPVGAANIAAGKIDAHADFCPWSEIMEYRGTGRKIFDGSQAGVPTFHGIVVRAEYAKEYPEVVVAVLRATLEAQKWIQDAPVMAAEKVSDWTGVEKEVLYLYFSEGGITTMDASIKPEWIEAMKYDHALLKKEKNIPDLDFGAWVDSSYIEEAYAQADMDYPQAVATLVKPEPDNSMLKAAQMWVEGKGILEYDSVVAMLEAYQSALSAGEDVAATYVYDGKTGLKMFGKVAFYIKDGDDYVAYMHREDAAQNSSADRVYSYQEALKSMVVNGAAWPASKTVSGRVEIRGEMQ